MEKRGKMNKKSNSRMHSLMRNKIVSCKRSQVTIFIIIAIVIVAVAIILFYPRIQTGFFVQKTPQSYIEDCLKPEIDSNLEKIENQGGSINPENTLLYKDNKIEYLCYTKEYYKTCVMQQPMLKQHIEQEIKTSIQGKAEECMNALAEYYKSKGYEVTKGKAEVFPELVPGNIKIEVNCPLSLKKESTESYNKIMIVKKSEIYDFAMIASSILNWEARYGDSAPESYMYYYPDLRVEKFKQEDGSKVYILSSRETNERFLFASRSLSWPAGYNVNQESVR